MKYLFDTKAIVALYDDEHGAAAVKSMLEEVEKGTAQGFASVITLTEVYYHYAKDSEAIAKEAVGALLDSKLDFVVVEQDAALRAGTYKKGGVPIADALIAAAAHQVGAKVVTDDPHFKEMGAEIILFR